MLFDRVQFKLSYSSSNQEAGNVRSSDREAAPKEIIYSHRTDCFGSPQPNIASQ